MSYWNRIELLDIPGAGRSRLGALERRPQTIVLARHGETEWGSSKQLTGFTDLPLTDRGERDARSLRDRLNGMTFQKVLCSPLWRDVATCEQAGFDDVAEIEPDLVEWDYGSYEGLRTDQIFAERPDWDLFRDGCPKGETPRQVANRADRLIRKVRACGGDVLLFSGDHLLRMFCARWLGLVPEAGRCFVFGPASLSALGFDHDRCRPVIRFYDDRRHTVA